MSCSVWHDFASGIFLKARTRRRWTLFPFCLLVVATGAGSWKRNIVMPGQMIQIAPWLDIFPKIKITENAMDHKSAL